MHPGTLILKKTQNKKQTVLHLDLINLVKREVGIECDYFLYHDIDMNQMYFKA